MIFVSAPLFFSFCPFGVSFGAWDFCWPKYKIAFGKLILSAPCTSAPYLTPLGNHPPIPSHLWHHCTVLQCYIHLRCTFFFLLIIFQFLNSSRLFALHLISIELSPGVLAGHKFVPKYTAPEILVLVSLPITSAQSPPPP